LVATTEAQAASNFLHPEDEVKGIFEYDDYGNLSMVTGLF